MAVTNVVGEQIIDMSHDTNYYFEVVPQGDSQSRSVNITLTVDGTTPYFIPTNATIILEGKNAGGYNIFTACTRVDDNILNVPLTNGVLSFAGVGKYDVGIFDGGTCIKSFPFNIVVTEAPYDIVSLMASDVYEALNELVAKAADSNRWIVENDDPVVGSTCPQGTHQNDYYLNAVTGAVFYAWLNPATAELEWQPVINTNTSRQLNILEKMYVRYADDDQGNGFSKLPAGKAYIGFYGSVNLEDDLDPTLDINIPSNYKWSVIGEAVDVDSSTILYGVSDSRSTQPSTWSQTFPATVNSGEFLWIKTNLVFESGQHIEYMTAISQIINAAFDNPGAVATLHASSGMPSVTLTDNGSVTAKQFTFDFLVRGAEFKNGTAISGSGQQTSTVFNDSNTVLGDMYINTSTGVTYICSAVTASNSTWDESITFGTITFIDDLKNTKRFYGLVTPGITTLTITGSDVMFVEADAYSPTSVYKYHVKYLTSMPGVSPTKLDPVVITNGGISSTLEFKNVKPNDLIVTPRTGTENPHDEGWYEEDATAVSGYSLTADTTITSGKTYYYSVQICMEVIKKNI